MARAYRGFHWDHLGDNLRLKIDHPVYDCIAINVLYTNGGVDPLNCDEDARGYYLSVMPVDRNLRGNRAEGAKIMLKPAGRRSDKSDALAVAKGVGMIPLVVADVCDKIGASYEFADLKAI